MERTWLWYLTGMVAGVFYLFQAALPASALYLFVDKQGQVHLSSEPLPNYVPIEPGARPANASPEPGSQQDIFVIVGEQYNFPPILLRSVWYGLKEMDRGELILPPNRLLDVSDTRAKNKRWNMKKGIELLGKYLLEYDGNLTVVLGRYYMGDERFEEIGGLPAESEARKFRDLVMERLDALRKGKPVLYTYVDENDQKHVVSLR